MWSRDVTWARSAAFTLKCDTAWCHLHRGLYGHLFELMRLSRIRVNAPSDSSLPGQRQTSEQKTEDSMNACIAAFCDSVCFCFHLESFRCLRVQSKNALLFSLVINRVTYEGFSSLHPVRAPYFFVKLRHPVRLEHLHVANRK